MNFVSFVADTEDLMSRILNVHTRRRNRGVQESNETSIGEAKINISM